MSNELDMPLGQRTAVVSLVAVFACALASDAVASRLPAEPSAGEQDLSARVAAIVEQIRLREPAIQRDLAPEVKIAQWRNR
jgi:hypothetical protein